MVHVIIETLRSTMANPDDDGNWSTRSGARVRFSRQIQTLKTSENKKTMTSLAFGSFVRY